MGDMYRVRGWEHSLWWAKWAVMVVRMCLTEIKWGKVKESRSVLKMKNKNLS